MKSTRFSTEQKSSSHARLEKLQNDLAGIYSQMSTKQKPNELKQVLIIDQDEHIQETVKIFLEEHGVKVTVAGNGLDALNHFHNSSFHLILTSTSVPVVSGNLIAIYVKNHTPNIPIIAMSQSGWMTEDYFDTVVEKPLDLPLLLQEILFQISRDCGATKIA